MNAMTFRVMSVNREKNMVAVAYGPIKFYCYITERDGKVLVNKPASIYVEQPDFLDLVLTVKNAWNASR